MDAESGEAFAELGVAVHQFSMGVDVTRVVMLSTKLRIRQKARMPPKLRLALIRRQLSFPSMPPASVSSLLRLPKRERLEIAESLWLSVADEEKMPVPEAHKKVLDARLADYRSGKSKVISHEVLMRRLRTT